MGGGGGGRKKNKELFADVKSLSPAQKAARTLAGYGFEGPDCIQAANAAPKNNIVCDALKTLFAWYKIRWQTPAQGGRTELTNKEIGAKLDREEEVLQADFAGSFRRVDKVRVRWGRGRLCVALLLAPPNMAV